jgi:hypothetical protein
MKMTKKIKSQLLYNVDSIINKLDYYINNSLDEIESYVLLERGELCIKQYLQFFPESENIFKPEKNSNNLLNDIIQLKSRLEYIKEGIFFIDLMSQPETDIIMKAGRQLYPNEVHFQSYIDETFRGQGSYGLDFDLAFNIIQKLSELDLIEKVGFSYVNGFELFPSYKLTNRGLHASQNPSFFREVLTEDDEVKISEISKHSAELIQKINNEITHALGEDLEFTIKEIVICIQNECYISAIALCGKVLEISLRIFNDDPMDGTFHKWTIGSFLHDENFKKLVPKESYLFKNMEVINNARIGRIHVVNNGYKRPNKEESLSIYYATSDTLKRLISLKFGGSDH